MTDTLRNKFGLQLGHTQGKRDGPSTTGAQGSSCGCENSFLRWRIHPAQEKCTQGSLVACRKIPQSQVHVEVGHRVQLPCSVRVMLQHMTQDYVQEVL